MFVSKNGPSLHWGTQINWRKTQTLVKCVSISHKQLVQNFFFREKKKTVGNRLFFTNLNASLQLSGVMFNRDLASLTKLTAYWFLVETAIVWSTLIWVCLEGIQPGSTSLLTNKLGALLGGAVFKAQSPGAGGTAPGQPEANKNNFNFKWLNKCK